ncbi:leucine-rich repeat-containing protein 9-like [Clytia hemisphaerica]
MEFSSGGNIRFEKGSSADVWYNSCQDLIQARFSPQEFKELGVSGVKIHKIRRIQNRLQKSRFEQKLENLSEGCTDDVIQYKDNSGKRLMDYLFLIPKVSGNIVDHFKIIEDGFHINTADHQESSTCSSVIQVTNNFRFLDKHRIKTTTTPPNKNDVKTNSDISFRYGQILICKVYLGKSCAVNNDKRLAESLYPGHQSVYRTKKHLASSCPSKVKKSLSTSATPQEYCECTARKCVWYLFDPDLVLPEYIVDFEYLSTVTPPMMSVFSELSKPTMSEEIRQQRFTEMCTKKPEEDTTDNNVLNLEPIIASRPRLTFLTEEMILKQSGQTYLNKITELNLHGCGLTKGKMLSSLSNIKKLVLSFNELTTMADLGGNSTLEYLDVSYNQITGMEGFKLCSNLTYLDIQWNRFYYTREDVGLIRKNIPALKYLKAAFNPWMKADSLRLRCIGRLRSLLSMDSEDVTQEETNTALRLAAGSRIAYITVLANSRTEKEPLRTLNLSNTTDVLITQSMNKPVKLSEDDRQWLSRVTCLRLDGQHLSKISNLEKLENLKWASFNDNDITKIEGLDNCKDLIELSLANNCLSKIDGIHHLKKLQSLDVSNNNLSSLDGIDFASLNNLRFLAFDNNFVLSLNGLQHSTSLLEIYAGNNKLQELRDIFYLKNIPTLIILDMMGNPLVKECNNYRLFLIYHLQSLKALDGIPVNFTEGGMAKDTFGGKLSTDFIAEKLGHSNFLELCELDLPHCNIRTVDLNSSELFKNLRSLNLEQNNLSCFGGIVNLHNLKVLCLNHNHIESIFPKKSGTNSPQVISTNKNASSDDSTNQFKAVLENLEVLHLGYNGIANLAALELGRLVSLKALFLQGNEINKVDGLDGLYELRELVLDKNKIKAFTENSFRNQWKLAELHVEENRLRDLSNLEPLTCLNRLYVGLNRLQYGTDLEKLECLPNLFELSVIGNPIARRMSHRMMLIFRQPNLLSIDGIPVSNEERSKAEIHFLEQQGGIQALQALSNSYDNSFPGLQSNNRNPLKVSNYTSSGPNERFWNPHHNEDKSRSKKNHRGSNKIPNNRYT